MAFNGLSLTIVHLSSLSTFIYTITREGGGREKQREKQRMRERERRRRESFTRIEYRDDRTLLLIMANNHRALFRGARN